MGKKTKSKARLDKYYYLAKEHGFRSRAAFKLIQLNKKFHFLESANVLLDLCAAPGGWCQVASKQMPLNSIKIGIDLDPIKPIPGVTTFQCDITSEQCRHLIRKEIKHYKADVVLNDGAPNVGGQWAKDSYTQTELVLFAIKLATEFLKEGGWFITKVFRSSDFNSLIYVMKQLFNKVESTKPLASRSQAAEIFVVCSGYKAPSMIDPKLLDPKYALKQLEEEDEMKANAIKSLKAMFAIKKSRGGYYNDSLYQVRTFKDFIECNNPYQFLYDTNKIEVKTEDCKKYVETVKPPKEYELYFKDIQLLSRKDMQELIIWRNKVRNKTHFKVNVESKQTLTEPGQQKDALEMMNEELKKIEAQKKKKLEKAQKKIEKNQLKIKKDFIDMEEENNDDNDIDFDENVFKDIQKYKIDIENMDNEVKAEEEENEDEEDEVEHFELSDLSEDDYIDMMNEDIEQNQKLYKEEKGLKKEMKELKNKKSEDEDIQMVQNEDEDDVSDISDNEDDNDLGDNSSDYEDDDLDMDEKNSQGEISLDEDKNDTFVNPLKKVKDNDNPTKKDDDIVKDEEDNLSGDTSEEVVNKKDKKYLSKKKERETKKKVDANNTENSNKSDSDGYDTDEKAEIRAIAKKMLRKKDRLNILQKSYNRYTYNDEPRLPKWFIEDEKIHNVPNKPVTKAEIMAEKSYLKKITDRMPKKVLEAKLRKKNRLKKRLDKIKKKAEAISNQDEITEYSKLKQIEKLYKKEINKSKEKKKYIVSRSFNNNSHRDGRNIRHVDRRLKKDKRAQKAKLKREKKYKRRR